MIARCNNPKTKSYKYYGARGIAVCKEWSRDFKAFYDHISGLPGFDNPKLTIDRINNDGNYEPGNIRLRQDRFKIKTEESFQ